MHNATILDIFSPLSSEQIQTIISLCNTFYPWMEEELVLSIKRRLNYLSFWKTLKYARAFLSHKKTTIDTKTGKFCYIGLFVLVGLIKWCKNNAAWIVTHISNYLDWSL